MILIARNHDLFELLKSSIPIISSSIKRFNIFSTYEDGLVIEVDLELLYDRPSVLRLRFKGVKEYSFYWNNRHGFYYIETYKLIKKENLFYICFDPEDETVPGISENDQDFILSDGFEGYYID